MSFNNIMLIMDMESGGCEKALPTIIDFANSLKGKINIFTVLESVKKAEDIAISLGMPFDVNMKTQSVDRVLERLKHMFPKDIVDNIYVKVGDFEEEVQKVFSSLNPDIIIVACNNFNKNISKFAKSVKKPILLIN